MPAKHQTCINCTGDCCLMVSYMRRQNLPLKYEPMNFSPRELRLLGYHEIYRPHTPCAAKTKDGCLIYAERPQLCRSYYCHGKYWKPKNKKQ